MQTSIPEQMQDIKHGLSNINVLIKGGNQEIVKILATLSNDNEYSYLEISKNISTVYNYIAKLEENFALTEEALQGTLMLLYDSESNHHLETVELLETIHSNISDIINSSFGDLSKEINFSIGQMSDRLTITHEQILQTQEDITDLLKIMQNDNEEMLLQVEAMIAEVSEKVLTIQQSLGATHEELKDLIIILRKSEDEHHILLLETLGKMERDMGETADSSFLQITEYIENLYTNICNEFKTLNQNLEGDFTALSENLSNYVYLVEQQIHSYSEKAGEDSNYLKTIIESGTNSINNRLDSVFQLVSNGKRNVASALLTKGVSIREDATFSEIYQGILDIPQQLLIGVQEIPGTISYDYHYHIDGVGATPHTGQVNVSGGCYTTAIYHAHQSSCYKDQTIKCNCSGYSQGNFLGYHAYDGWPMWECSNCKHGNWEHDSGKCTVSSTSKVLICGKTTITAEYYIPSCNLSDGQIIGAHITYN